MMVSMKEKIYDLTFALILFISIIFIFKENNEIAIVILNAINLFFKKVFTSLFPMFILNDLLICLNIPYYFYYIFNKPFKLLFKTSGLASYVLIMSLISGTPSNAYILKNLVSENKISIKEANHYLYFTYFSNPLFLTMILSSIFTSPIVIKIILIHYLSNLIIAFLKRNIAPIISDNNLIITNGNISKTLIKSIKKSIDTLLTILGTIVFYMLLSFIITSIIPTSYLFKTLISSFLEITNGLNLLKNLDIALKIKEIIAVVTISFGGLSINTQIKAILEDSPLSFKYFFKGRLMQAFISFILILIF